MKHLLLTFFLLLLSISVIADVPVGMNPYTGQPMAYSDYSNQQNTDNTGTWSRNRNIAAGSEVIIRGLGTAPITQEQVLPALMDQYREDKQQFLQHSAEDSAMYAQQKIMQHQNREQIIQLEDASVPNLINQYYQTQIPEATFYKNQTTSELMGIDDEAVIPNEIDQYSLGEYPKLGGEPKKPFADYVTSPQFLSKIHSTIDTDYQPVLAEQIQKLAQGYLEAENEGSHVTVANFLHDADELKVMREQEYVNTLPAYRFRTDSSDVPWRSLTGTVVPVQEKLHFDRATGTYVPNVEEKLATMYIDAAVKKARLTGFQYRSPQLGLLSQQQQFVAQFPAFSAAGTSLLEQNRTEDYAANRYRQQLQRDEQQLQYVSQMPSEEQEIYQKTLRTSPSQ